jgi:hypothetical protein
MSIIVILHVFAIGPFNFPTNRLSTILEGGSNQKNVKKLTKTCSKFHQPIYKAYKFQCLYHTLINSKAEQFMELGKFFRLEIQRVVRSVPIALTEVHPQIPTTFAIWRCYSLAAVSSRSLSKI